MSRRAVSKVAVCFLMAVSIYSPIPADSITVYPSIDIPITASAAVISALSMIAENERNIVTSAEMTPSRINPVDRMTAGRNNPALSRLSDFSLGAALAIPAALFGLWSGHSMTIGESLLLLSESLSINMLLVQNFKNAVLRPRPLLYSNSVGLDGREERDNYNSFYSGHAALSFCSATTVLLLGNAARLSSEKRAGLAAVGFSLAAATGILRVLSGKHFPTDVLAGAVTGAATSFIVAATHTNDTAHDAAAPVQAAVPLNLFSITLVY